MKTVGYKILGFALGGLGAIQGVAAGASDEVWAVNVAGPTFVGGDGTVFAAEQQEGAAVRGGEPRRIDTVRGTPDEALYRTMREGGVRIARRLANGTYDLTLYFAEPDQVSGGQRVFDVTAEHRTVLRGVDVMAFRDGKVRSALTITVPDVTVADGMLNVAFEPSAGAPVLSALAVRRAIRPDASAWQLVWQDEFDGEAIDETRWTAERWPARKVNDEDQAYTARAENLRVEDGQLVIEARREAYGEAQYTSGRLHSAGKGDFLYGRFEVRARLPRGKGTWPAIWMLPSDAFRYATTCNAGEWQGRADCDAWPNSGEIDIMEHVGYQPGHVHATVHNQAYYWVTWEQRKGRVVLADVADAFHVYALEWSPGRIDAFVDDTRYFTYVNEGEGWRSWPYDQPFHLILNLAVGGVWGRAGGGIDAEALPQQLRVDYVRVYQRTAGDGPAAGTAPAAP